MGAVWRLKLTEEFARLAAVQDAGVGEDELLDLEEGGDLGRYC